MIDERPLTYFILFSLFYFMESVGLSSIIFSILIPVPIKLVSKLLIPGSLWMVLTCLEGSSEAVEWRMDRIPDLIKVQRSKRL